MLNVITSRRNIEQVAVRVYWDDMEHVMAPRVTWDKKRLDEVVLNVEQVHELGLTAHAMGHSYVQVIEHRTWMRMVSAVDMILELADGPRKLEYELHKEFEDYSEWLLKLAMGLEPDCMWEAQECGDHRHLVRYSLDGTVEQIGTRKYGFTIPSTLTPEEYIAMKEVEAMNDPALRLMAMLAAMIKDEPPDGWGEFDTTPDDGPELDGDVWDLSSIL